jgi:ribosome recycling factor
MNFNLPEVANAFEEYEFSLMETIDHLKSELSTIRAGRANPQILNKIIVDYYGAPTPINQMANITVPEARLLQISLWDTSMIKAVVKASLFSVLERWITKEKIYKANKTKKVIYKGVSFFILNFP